MANVASKNQFDILGNDLGEESDPEPTRVVDKPLPRTTKRNAPDVAPQAPRGHERGGQASRGGGFRANDADREGLRADRHPGRLAGGSREDGTYEGRGARGGRGRRGARDDRHSRTGRVDTEKEVAQGWGRQTGDAEWTDEKAGEAIAQADEKAAGVETEPDGPVGAEGNHPGGDADPPAANEEPEPVDNTKSYADYLAELAEKRLALGAPEARKPNENAQSEKWAQAKELKRNDEEDEFIAGSGPKAKRDRQRKEKNYIDIEHRPMEPPRAGRGGRGRGEGRGEYRGRGRGEGRGNYRRGGGGGRGADESVNLDDPAAFPTLGGPA